MAVEEDWWWSPSHLHLLHHILHLHHVDVLDALRLELRAPLLDELLAHLYMGMWGGEMCDVT